MKNISKIKLLIILIFTILVGMSAGIIISYIFLDSPQKHSSILSQEETGTNSSNYLKSRVEYLEHEADRWMYYAHIYYSCLADPQSSLAEIEKKYFYQRYVAKAASTISFIYADQKNLDQEDNLVLTFLFSQVAFLLETGKITKSDLRDPLGIDWIFNKYPKENAEKTSPVLTMEYTPAILANGESYRKFSEWFYKKVVYYKENRKKIESEHFPYDIIVPKQLYKRWQKKYGIKYGAPLHPYLE